MSIRENTGDCTKQELVEKKTDQQAIVRLVCARGNLLGALTVNADPSHLIDGLVLKPEGHGKARSSTHASPAAEESPVASFGIPNPEL